MECKTEQCRNTAADYEWDNDGGRENTLCPSCTITALRADVSAHSIMVHGQGGTIATLRADHDDLKRDVVHTTVRAEMAEEGLEEWKKEAEDSEQTIITLRADLEHLKCEHAAITAPYRARLTHAAKLVNIEKANWDPATDLAQRLDVILKEMEGE